MPSITPGQPTPETEAAAFARLAPPDKVLDDPNVYASSDATGSIPLANVTEETSVKRHTIMLKGKEYQYTARAGHLIAYKQDATGKTPQAAIFYTAYLRDGVPKEKRPVTFFFNGGPGSPSIWLHLGAWGPKRLLANAPDLPPEQPQTLPMVDNEISLLDKTDLVFVDPPGTGLSVAIAPQTNQDFLAVEPDIEVVKNFIISFVNHHNRQGSQKYLYGESYSGVRIPIVARELLEQGTTQYNPDPTGAPPRVLDGIILNSPILDYSANCDKNSLASCNGFIPTYAMVADFHGKSMARGSLSNADYAEKLQRFADTEYAQWFELNSKLVKTVDEQATLQAIAVKLQAFTGIPASTWRTASASTWNMKPGTFKSQIMPGWKLGRYDARGKLPLSSNYDPDNFDDIAFPAALKTLLPDFVNYRNSSIYKVSGNTWKRDGWKSTIDFARAYQLNPVFKSIIVHGYHDAATPFHQSVIDLKKVKLDGIVPVKVFDGGHMIYYTESSRAPLRAVLDEFYDKPATLASQNSVAAISPLRKH
ncbi:S10 family serine carboxypeptidase-like protein [Burkholderia cepacia]|uniref:S10 family serine carboxypeptidase-like protein n=1 Tax=Burkholderia cepacia TaxID=292 RepID=UPI000B2B9EA1|nr:peptidase [Burkholderia cepacia]